jgi:hypothetical protein
MSEEGKAMVKGFIISFAVLSAGSGLYIISGGTLKLAGLIIGGLLMFLAAMFILAAVLVVVCAVAGDGLVDDDENLL